jgi:hypothetical protein
MHVLKKIHDFVRRLGQKSTARNPSAAYSKGLLSVRIRSPALLLPNNNAQGL